MIEEEATPEWFLVRLPILNTLQDKDSRGRLVICAGVRVCMHVKVIKPHCLQHRVGRFYNFFTHAILCMFCFIKNLVFINL